MGLLKLLAKPAPTLLRLPSGSFTVDAHGSILAATLPSSYPRPLLREIAQQVLRTFRQAGASHLHLAQISVYYASLKITARALRGGALVFLAPKAPFDPSSPS